MTYYPDDQEPYDTWIALGIDPSHLIPVEGNFWEIGPGPCGPDTEIFFDRGETYDTRGVELIKNDIENERFIEIWNVVFHNLTPPKVFLENNIRYYHKKYRYRSWSRAICMYFTKYKNEF